MSGSVRDDADLLDQKPSVACPSDDHPPASYVAVSRLATGYIVWPAPDSNLLTAQRSFVQDMASRHAICRPSW